MRRLYMILLAMAIAVFMIGCAAKQTAVTLSSFSSYTVRFNANGGSGTMEEMTAVVDVEITLPVATFIPPEGKEFDFWGTVPDANGYGFSCSTPLKNIAVEDGAVVTLYAQWKDITD